MLKVFEERRNELTNQLKAAFGDVAQDPWNDEYLVRMETLQGRLIPYDMNEIKSDDPTVIEKSLRALAEEIDEDCEKSTSETGELSEAIYNAMTDGLRQECEYALKLIRPGELAIDIVGE